MVKEQIEIEVLPADHDAFLPGEEGELRAELQQEALELAKNCRLQVLLGISIVQTEKIEQVGVFEDQIRGKPIALPQHRELLRNEPFSLL